MSEFLTIRQAAADPRCPLREGTLRAMSKRQELPGFYSGNRFWLNFDELLETLTERSRANMKANIW